MRSKTSTNSLDIMRQTACLVINPIIVDGYASLFNCKTAVRASDSMTVSPGGWGLTICLWLGSTGFHLLWHTVELAMSTRLCLVIYLIFYVLALMQ